MEVIVREDREGIAFLTINRPEKYNALNASVFAQLDQHISDVLLDNSVKGILIKGAGEKAFAAGADIAEFSGLTSKEAEALSLHGQAVFRRLEASFKPTLALVHGFALGGGLELAMACQLRYVTEEAQMGLPESSLGILPGYGGTQRLPALVGKAKALELILSGRKISGAEAARIGLANAVFSNKEDALDAAMHWFADVFQKAPLAIREVIACLHADKQADGFALEAKSFGLLSQSHDFKEGVAAFLEKRKPSFKGN